MKQQQFKRSLLGFDRAQVAEYLIKQNIEYVDRENALRQKLDDLSKLSNEKSNIIESLSEQNKTLTENELKLTQSLDEYKKINADLNQRITEITAQLVAENQSDNQHSDAVELLEALAKYIKSVHLPKGKLIDLA